jgi:hypothetical protein
MISVLGASGSNRETITTGRVFAARPRSANQISPGRGFIQEVQNFLFAGPGTQQIERVLIRQSNNFAYAFTHLVGRLRPPLMQFGVQRFKQGFHQDLHLETILRGFSHAVTESTGVTLVFPNGVVGEYSREAGAASIFLTDNERFCWYPPRGHSQNDRI